MVGTKDVKTRAPHTSTLCRGENNALHCSECGELVKFAIGEEVAECIFENCHCGNVRRGDDWRILRQNGLGE